MDVRVLTEQVLARQDVEALYALYLTALNPLLTQAAARHVLNRAEFEDEMNDPRIEKIVVRDDGGAPVAFTTLATDLTAIPWVNPVYYAEQFPDVVARGAMFYLGYVLVDPAQRRSNALLLMADLVNRRLSEAEGVIAFDICAFNVAYGVGQRTAQILHQARSVEQLDSQTYYAADFRPAEGGQHRATAPAEPAERRGPLRAHSLEERAGLADQIPALLQQLSVQGVPVARDRLGVDAVLAQVPPTQVLLLEDSERLRGAALWLPITWDGSPQNLPQDWQGALARGLRAHGAGTGDAVVALPLVPEAEVAGAAFTAPLLGALGRAAAATEARTVLIPVRPVGKSRYPLILLDDYLTWQADGSPFDPAVRLHTALGAHVAGTGGGLAVVAPREQWAETLSVPLPGDGAYVFDGGLAPLTVRNRTGSYREPRIWMAYDGLVGSLA